MTYDPVLPRRTVAIPRPRLAVDSLRPALPLAVLVSVPLLALNIRPAVTSLGATLSQVRSGTGMSDVVASIVVAAPVWCFAAGGALAWALQVRLGTARTVGCALAALTVALAARVAGGQHVLLAGTIAACLAVAVLGTMLPAIVHVAPAHQWSMLTGCYIATMGGGSAVGALITPPVTGHTSWRLGVGSWALLAGTAWLLWRAAAPRIPEQSAADKVKIRPRALRPIATKWSLTLHFGLASGFTFSIMGWLPSVLLERAQVSPAAGWWLFTVAMGLGVPLALLIPRVARHLPDQGGLAVTLAAPSLLAVVGLLIGATTVPWLWAVGLGLGMPAVGLGLALISMRADSGATAAALSSMVQGCGYAVAGTVTLGIGLLHHATASWEWPLVGLLVVLCGQIVTGILAGRPVTIRPKTAKGMSRLGPDPDPAVRDTGSGRPAAG